MSGSCHMIHACCTPEFVLRTGHATERTLECKNSATPSLNSTAFFGNIHLLYTFHPQRKISYFEFSLFTFFFNLSGYIDPRNPKTPPAIVVMLQEVEDNVHRWIPDVTCPVVPIHLQTWWATGRCGAYHREIFILEKYLLIYVKYRNYRKNTWRTQTCMSFLFQFAALLHLLFPVCSGPWSFLLAYGLHLITHPIHAYHV